MRWPGAHRASGDLVAVEALTHHAGDAPDLLMDSGIRAVFEQVTDRGPGPHLLTGPIAVHGAQPGDVLQVDILEATPRLPYGSNLAAHWGGYLYDLTAVERVTIYELDSSALRGRAVFGYDWNTTPLADQPGAVVDPGSVRREPALPGVTVPLRPHFGTMGVAPPVATGGCRRCHLGTTAAISTTGGSVRADGCTTGAHRGCSTVDR